MTERLGIKDLDFGQSTGVNPIVDRPLGLPDVDRNPKPVNFPLLYQNTGGESLLRQNIANYINSLNTGVGVVQGAIVNANAREAEAMQRVQQQTEMIRKHIASQQRGAEDEHTGLGAFIFGRKKDYSKHRTVNPLRGEYGEQGGGVLGFLGYVLDSLSGVSASTNAENFRQITPDDPNASYRAGSNALRALGSFAINNFSPKLWYNVLTGERQFLDSRDSRRVATAFSELFALDRRKDRDIYETVFDQAPKSLRALFAAALPTNWGVGLNPFARDVGLNNRRANNYVKNLTEVFTQGRKFSDSDNALTADGLFYDPKRIVNGKDTYDFPRKLGSALWSSIINPGDKLTDMLLIDSVVAPVIGTGYRRIKNRVTRANTVNTAVLTDPLQAKIRNLDEALKSADDVLKQKWWDYPDPENIKRVLSQNGGIIEARRKVANGNASKALRDAVNVHEHRRYWKPGVRLLPEDFAVKTAQTVPKGVVAGAKPPTSSTTKGTEVGGALAKRPTELPDLGAVQMEAVLETRMSPVVPASLGIPTISRHGVVPPLLTDVEFTKVRNGVQQLALPSWRGVDNTATTSAITKLDILGATPSELRSVVRKQTLDYADGVYRSVNDIADVTGLPVQSVAKYLIEGKAPELSRSNKRLVNNVLQQILTEKTQQAPRVITLPPASVSVRNADKAVSLATLADELIEGKAPKEVTQFVREMLDNPRFRVIGDDITDVIPVRQKIAETTRLRNVRDNLNIPDAFDMVLDGDTYKLSFRSVDQVADEGWELLVDEGGKLTGRTKDGRLLSFGELTDVDNSALDEAVQVLSDYGNIPARKLPPKAAIAIPTPVKISEAVKLPRIKNKQLYLGGSLLRSDGSTLALLDDILPDTLIPNVDSIGIPTRYGVMSPQELLAIPKADLLEDLQQAQLNIVDRLQILDNADNVSISIPLQTSTFVQDEIAQYVPKVTQLKVSDNAIVNWTGDAYHGTAVADWLPNYNSSTQSVNTFGFGTYLTNDIEYASAASRRFLDATFDYNVPIDSPKIVTVQATEPLKLLDPQQVTLVDEVTGSTMTLERAYVKAIELAADGGVLDELTARKLLVNLDQSVIEAGYDGLILYGDDIKVLNTNKLTTTATQAVDINPRDLVDGALAELVTHQKYAAVSPLDASRAVDAKYELLKQTLSVVDDALEDAQTLAVEESFKRFDNLVKSQFDDVDADVLRIAKEQEEYLDDISKLDDYIDGDPCGL